MNHCPVFKSSLESWHSFNNAGNGEDVLMAAELVVLDED